MWIALCTTRIALKACDLMQLRERRRVGGPYLPTVPELTHMPLSWWFSRSLKPDRGALRTEVVPAVVPPFQVRVSQKATRRTLHGRPSAPSHPSALAARSPPPYSGDSSRCTASWRIAALDRARRCWDVQTDARRLGV